MREKNKIINELRFNLLSLHYNKIEILLSITIAFMIIFIGAILNTACIMMNNGRMPVYTENYINSFTHFNFNNINEIKLFDFSDKFNIKFSNGYILFFSVGDILVVIGILLISVCIVNLVFMLVKENKIKKIIKNAYKNE